MKNSLTRCPVCDNELVVTRLHCDGCDTTIEGRFVGGPFSHLDNEQLNFIEVFIRCEGKINRMETELGFSYPTIRNRLHEVIRALGYEPGKDESPDVSEERRIQTLEDLDAGKISAEDAMRILRGEEQ
ncbi:MAG: DUF2089 domain-containing protein [Anaerolineales bacterium]